ncbi:MAG: type II toxin-antitoxin system prevent-host-death family antitoxin [Rhizobiales bacterium]|nr:type II toxin-antitoxin system prevent-host-death family antitoxin [Rhizobacter sp.]
MREIAVYEAKTRLSELLAEVEQGEQITITRRGLPIARLVSAVAVRRGAASERQRVAATIASLREQRKGVVLEGDLHELIAEGRD